MLIVCFRVPQWPEHPAEGLDGPLPPTRSTHAAHLIPEQKLTQPSPAPVSPLLPLPLFPILSTTKHSSKCSKAFSLFLFPFSKTPPLWKNSISDIFPTTQISTLRSDGYLEDRLVQDVHVACQDLCSIEDLGAHFCWRNPKGKSEILLKPETSRYCMGKSVPNRQSQSVPQSLWDR